MNTGTKSAFFCALATTVAALLPLGGARGQTVFTTIQAFGDSYADTGNLFKILGTPNPCAVSHRPVEAAAPISWIRQRPCWGFRKTTLLLAVHNPETTNVVGPGIPGFTQEWQGFIALGQEDFFRPTSWKLASAAMTPALYYQTGGTLAGVSPRPRP